MSLNPGDRRYTMGEELSVTNTSGDDLDRGDWASITGDHEVGPVDASGSNGTLDVVIDYPIPAGESGKAHFGGGVYARVADAVDVGDHLVAANSTNSDEEVGEAMSGGDQSDPVVLGEPIQDDDGYHYALVQF